MRQKSFIFVAVAPAGPACGRGGRLRVRLVARRRDRAGRHRRGRRRRRHAAPREARRIARARAARRRWSSRSSVVHAGRRFSLSAQDAGVHADVDGMVDEALAKSRNGNIISRVARDITGGEENAQVPARVTYYAGGDRRARASACASRRQPPGARRRGRLPVARRRSRSARARRSTRGLLRQRVAQALTVPGVDRRVQAPVRITQPEGHPGAARRQVPGAPGRRPHQLQAPPLQAAEAGQGRTPSPSGAVGFDTPAGLYHIQNKAGEPRLDRAEQRLGGRSRRHGRSRAACPTTRSRRAGWASSTARASTAPTRPTRSATPPRTAASAWRSRT